MNDPRTIHDYLDGSLSAAEEEALFISLAASDDARVELRSQVRLHHAVKKDLASVVVPPSLDAAVFERLGYAVPPALATPLSVATPNHSSRRRSWLALLLLLLGGATGAGLMWLGLQSPHNGAGPVRARAELPSPAPAAPAPTSAQRIESVSAQHESPNAGRAATSLTDVRDEAAQTQHLTTDVDTISAPDDDPAPVTASWTPIPTVMISPVHTLPDQIRPGASIINEPLTVHTRGPWSVMLDGRALFAGSPTLEETDQGISQRDQFTVGVGYDVSALGRISVLGGRQIMPQEFLRFEDGRNVYYRQAPNLWWVGVGYQRALPELRVADIVVPMATATLGWMETGPMARVGAGIMILPDAPISLQLGIEGTMMAYPIQSVFYTSTAWSATYGVRVRF